MIYCPYCEPTKKRFGWLALTCVDCQERLMEMSMAAPDSEVEPRLADPNDPLVKLLKAPEVDP